MVLFVEWSVKIDGLDCTAGFNPYVMEIEVEDKAGSESDTARVTLNDADGAIIIPRKGASIEISILGEPTFKGTTETPRSTGSRGGGMLMTLSAKGFDPEKGAKEGRHFHKDDATLDDYLKDFGKRAGIGKVKVDPDLAKIKRVWWGPDGRSFLHEAQRLADELGATFKMQGDTAVFAKQGNGKTPAGGTLPTITARRPGNLISWDIEPYDAREVFRDVRVRRFDRKSAKFVEEKVDVESKGTPSASAMLRGTRADEDDAKSAGAGRKTKADRDKGGGTVEIDIDPTARAEATCQIVGTRSGVDGEYRVESATHTVSRGGATTTLRLKQPGDTAGKDTRKAGDTDE